MTLIYPKKVWKSENDATGAGMDTTSVDYVRFQVVSTYQNQGTNKTFEFTPQQSSSKTTGEAVYLYMPVTLQANYAANYNSVPLGAVGVAAAAALKSSSSIDLASAVQGFAQSAGPEYAFNTVATGLSAIKDFTGTGGGQFNASQLSAISQGKIFNPYMEQIFEAPGFRDHNFSFKMVARNEEEAKTIKSIITFFKKNMLPTLEGYTPAELKSAGQTQEQLKASDANKATDKASQAAQAAATNAFTQQINQLNQQSNRWLTVPNRFDISFQRLGSGGGVVSSSGNNLNLYRFKTCVLKSCQVNYVPDGQYVAVDPSFNWNAAGLPVPAVQIDLSFSETEIITSADAAAGF